jgi:hypothetical protein
VKKSDKELMLLMLPVTPLLPSVKDLPLDLLA